MARRARRVFAETGESFDQQEARAIAEFSRHFHIQFRHPELLRLALTHRSYLSVTGMGPRESNERLEFLGDSVLGLVTSEYLYRHHPNEHEGQLTKTKSLLVSKAILSRRALQIGLGRFILLSHSEIESGGRKRASILADAFESVLGAVYLDQGFEEARRFVVEYLLRGSTEIVADKRHRNYKSQLQEYVQSTFHTHPVYRIRSQMGPDHSKLFLVEVMVGRRTLGEGRGSNKKEAEQAAARDAIEGVAEPRESREERPRREPRESREPREERAGREPRESREPREERAGREPRESREPREERAGREPRESREPREERAGREPRESREPREERAGREPRESREPRDGRASQAPSRPETGTPRVAVGPSEAEREARGGRRGGRGRRRPEPDVPTAGVPGARVGPLPGRLGEPLEMEPRPGILEEDDVEEIGRPEGPLDERHESPFETGPLAAAQPDEEGERWSEEPPYPEGEDRGPDESPGDGPALEDEEPGLPPEVGGDVAEREDDPWSGASRDASPVSPQFGRKRQRRR